MAVVVGVSGPVLLIVLAIWVAINVVRYIMDTE